MTINVGEETLEVLEDLVSNVLDDASVRRDYSGRGMYGDVCLGLVVGDVAELVQFVCGVQSTARALELDGDQEENSEDQQVLHDLLMFLDALENGGTTTCSDGMGTQVIYYWPRVRVTS